MKWEFSYYKIEYELLWETEEKITEQKKLNVFLCQLVHTVTVWMIKWKYSVCAHLSSTNWVWGSYLEVNNLRFITCAKIKNKNLLL